MGNRSKRKERRTFKSNFSTYKIKLKKEEKFVNDHLYIEEEEDELMINF